MIIKTVEIREITMGLRFRVSPRIEGFSRASRFGNTSILVVEVLINHSNHEIKKFVRTSKHGGTDCHYIK